MGIFDFLRNATHNAELYRTGRANWNEVRLTTVGWRPDPINKEDGYTESSEQPSGNHNGEYYRVIRYKNGKKP